MARINNAPIQRKTHEGAPACHLSPIAELRRTVLACLLWEDGFYESGQSVAQRIADLVARCKPHEVAALAVEARNAQRLRHAPLLLVRQLAKMKATGTLVSETLRKVIQRPDELSEFLALYWKDGKQPLSAQVKKGLARAFRKFSAYQLAKYNRDTAIKLRDVLFLVHAKPRDEEQAAVWKQLVDGTLPAPDTWEVALSAGADKRETFERLIVEGKLGYLALLRNLRNMASAGVSSKLVGDALEAGAESSKALPFRYVAAARAVPAWEPMIDSAMLKAMGQMPRLLGRTVVLVDVSGSMDHKLSDRSDLTRLDAAAALAVLIRGICDDIEVLTFSNGLAQVPPRHGMALIDAIRTSQPHVGTYLGQAVGGVNRHTRYDRLIVITDEQSADPVPAPAGRGYMINVATNQNGVGYGQWTKISGWSEAAVTYIQALEHAEQE